MDCKPCEEKKKAAEAAKLADSVVDVPQIDTGGPYGNFRRYIKCFCGLSRLIPAGLNVNDTFELVPCPRCGSDFKGRFDGEQVEQL